MSTSFPPSQVEGRCPVPADPQLISLPWELQRQIVDHLDYPDLLSLKLTHPYFQHILLPSRPTIRERIGWVLSRGKQSLAVPHLQKTDFRTDEKFLQNPEVQRILRRRRCHHECIDAALRLSSQRVGNSKPGKGWLLPCVVIEGQTCPRASDFGTYRFFLGKLRGGRIFSGVKMNVKPWIRSWLSHQRVGQGAAIPLPRRNVSRTGLVANLVMPLLIVGIFWLSSKITPCWDFGIYVR